MGFMAVILAIGFSAFTANKKMTADKLDGLYWYDSITGDEFPNNPQVNPPSGCTTTGSNCALGFASPEAYPVLHSGDAIDRKSHN